MNDHATKKPAPQPDDELLVAYLDGELAATASIAIERRLADEPSLRARLQALMGTWDMLDHLPRATVDDTFAHTTVAMVAMKAAARLDRRAAGSDTGVRLLGGMVLLAAVAFGFRWAGTLSPSPNERLLRDLPVIEQLDLYRQVDDAEFVRQLHERRLFPADGVSADGVSADGVSADDDAPAAEDRDGQ